jgi:hypothetical protein
VTVADIIAEGDRVVMKKTYTGTDTARAGFVVTT